MIFFRKRLAGCWLGIQTVILSRSDRLPRRWGQQAPSPGVHRLSMTHSERQRTLMMHAQCPLPVYYSQDMSICHRHEDWWCGPRAWAELCPEEFLMHPLLLL